MKIGILGTGNVGRALGNGFIATGNDVKMGARQAGNEKARSWADSSGPRASDGTFADAASFGEVVVLATLWDGTRAAISAAGKERFAGKVVIDATNPLRYVDGRPAGLALGHTDSGGEQVQRWLPAARVVKAFNTVGNAHMYRPDFPGGPPDMFIAGDDDGAKRTVTGILTAFGWETIDLGGIEASRVLEPICWAWVLYAVRTGTWNHAFKLLKK
jgi:predicted dinucleotide-binding enzyme